MSIDLAPVTAHRSLLTSGLYVAKLSNQSNVEELNLGTITVKSGQTSPLYFVYFTPNAIHMVLDL